MIKSRPNGTTLIELVLYMGLLSIFLTIIVQLFSQLINTQNRSTAVSLIQTNGNILLTKLAHEINQADSIVTPLAVGSSASSMVLEIGATDYTYTVVGNRLQLNDTNASYNLNDVDTAITNFTVTRIGNPDGLHSLKINFTITSLIPDDTGTKSVDLTTTATLR